MLRVAEFNPREAKTRSRYVRLAVDALSLVVPQSEIHTLEPLADVATDAASQGSVGWITAEGQRWPVYCFSKELTPMKTVPAGRRICVLVADGGRYFGLLCDQVQTLEGDQFLEWPLPECMKGPSSPVSSLILQGEKVYGMTTAAALAAYIGYQS